MEPGTMETAVRVLLGFAVLLAGRNIFWAFIAVIGFVLGIELAPIWLADHPAWLVLAAGLVLGLVGAVLAIVFERVAFALAGFYAGAFLVIVGAVHLGFTHLPAVAPFIAGLIGAVLAAILTDWAIIVLSVLAGAALVISSVSLPSITEAVVFPVLVVIGILVQRNLLARRTARDAGL
jgi:hypothetical protein